MSERLEVYMQLSDSYYLKELSFLKDSSLKKNIFKESNPFK